MPARDAEIEVVNAYQWVLNPRFGKVHVYIDGKEGQDRPSVRLILNERRSL
jgi:hypothetical protein